MSHRDQDLVTLNALYRRTLAKAAALDDTFDDRPVLADDSASAQ